MRYGWNQKLLGRCAAQIVRSLQRGFKGDPVQFAHLLRMLSNETWLLRSSRSFAYTQSLHHAFRGLLWINFSKGGASALDKPFEGVFLCKRSYNFNNSFRSASIGANFAP